MTGRFRDVTDEIRRRINILEVVAPHVTLRRAGRSYKGLCPFHSEKTPSFTVDPERGFFYCFGCHAGGDAFDFVMRIGSLSFREALQELAGRTGVRLPQVPADEHHPGERERLLRAAAEAEAWFRAQLAADAGEAARRYLAERGVDPRTREVFRLGWAAAGWDGLLRSLGARGFEASVLEQAGLVTPRSGGDGYYDALRERVVFPIHDLQGRPVAFGGRALGDGAPKYLNTRESPIFVKGKTLYAIDAARQAIRDAGEAVVVEGYMDAVSCHQFGIHNAVASLGTALTPDQVLLLKRFAASVVLVYDADAAGIQAAERGLGVFQGGLSAGLAAEHARSSDAFAMPAALFDRAELPVRVAVLPGGTDPDAYLRQHGAEAFRRLLAEAQPIFQYRLAMAVRRHDPETVEGKVGIVDEVAQLITTVSHPVRQAEYIRLLAERLGVREDAVRGQLRRMTQRAGGGARQGPTGSGAVSEASARARAEELLLHIMVADGAVRRALCDTVEPERFRNPGHRALAEALLAADARDDEPGRLRERLRDEAAVSLLSRFLIAEPPVRGDPRRVADGCVQQIRLCDLEERIGRLLEAHTEAVRSRDVARRDVLAAELLEARKEKDRIRELKVGV
jgi:DNA primase